MNADQARMARAVLKLSARDLASSAKVSPNTVTRLEVGLPVHNATVVAIRGALESAGVIFVDENGEGHGVRLRKARSIPKNALNNSRERL
jgi:hypothetical protein